MRRSDHVTPSSKKPQNFQRFRPKSREFAERAWRAYQEEIDSPRELPSSILKSHKANLSEKGGVRQMLCTDPCCEVCNSVALEADLLFKSTLPELASWALPSDLSLNLPSNLSLVPSPSQNTVSAHTSSVNPSSSLATNILPAHTLSLSPINPMDLSFSLPHSSSSATTPFQAKSPIRVQTYSQSSTTSRTHISVLAHTSTVVRTSLTTDAATETTSPVVLDPSLAPTLSGALKSSLQPNLSLAPPVVQTPSTKPNIPAVSAPSANPRIPQESASQCITHTSLLDLQSDTIPPSSAPISSTITPVALTFSTAPRPPVAHPTPVIPPALVAPSIPVAAPPPVAPPPSIIPTPLLAPTPPVAPQPSIIPTPLLAPTPPITPTLSFAPTLPVTPVPPMAPGPFVPPSPYFAPTPSFAPAPLFAPAPYFTPTPSFAPAPPFDSAPSVPPTLSVASIPSMAPASALDRSFLIDPAYLKAHPQLCHSPYVAHPTSVDPNYARTYTTSVVSTPSLAPTHSSTFTSSNDPSMVPIFSRSSGSSSPPPTPLIASLKVPSPPTKPARISRFHTSSVAPKASLAHTSSRARTLEDTFTSSVVHLPSTCTGSISHTPPQASTSSSTICTSSVVHPSLQVCISSTSPTTSVTPTFSQASPTLQEKTCSQILRSSLFCIPSGAHAHPTTQTTSVGATTTTLHETVHSQVLRVSLAGTIPVVHSPPMTRSHPVNHMPLLNHPSSPAHTPTPSRKPLVDHMHTKESNIFLNPTPLVAFQPPQQSSPTPRPPNLLLAPATCEEPDLLSIIPKVLSTDDAPLMISAPLTSDIDESCSTSSGSSQRQNSQEFLMLPYLVPWGSQREPLSLGLSEPYKRGQKGEQKGTLPIPVPEEKPGDNKTSERQKNLVPFRLQLSEQATNARAQKHSEANEVPLLSPSAQELLETHITEKRALHIWKEKEPPSKPRPDLSSCFHSRELKKVSLVLEDTQSSVKDLWTPDQQSCSAHGADQSLLHSEGSLVNSVKPEEMPNSQQPHNPVSLILSPTTLHFLNRLCSMPGWGPENTVSHNRQCIQLFWGLPSLHSESLVTTYMGSSSPSWLGTTIKLPPGDNPLVFFNDLSYLYLPNSASRPTLPSSIQHLKLLPTSYSTSSRPSSPPSPPLSTTSLPPSPSTPPVTSPPTPSPSTSLPQIRTFRIDPEETTVRIPTIYLPKFQALEWHLLQKQLQSLWGVPHVVQRSHEAFNPLPLQLPQVHKSPCPQMQISNWPQELSFLSKDVKKRLETHLQRRLVQHHWGLARRVEDSIKHLVPQTIPQQGSARPRKAKPSTFQGLKRSDKKDAVSDSTAVLGVTSAVIPEMGPARHTEESPKSDLDKSPSPSQQEALQKHFLQKSVAIQQKVVPESVSRSWASAKGRSVSLQPTHPPQRQLKMKEIVPMALSMEDTATQTQSQPQPQPQIQARPQIQAQPPPQPQPQPQPWASSPTEEMVYEVEPCKDISFLDPETKNILESHIRHMHIRLKWGLPKKVLESIYLFKLKNPSIQISSPIVGKGLGPDTMVGERNHQEIWVGGVAREASTAVLDILEAEKASWNIGKELWEAPQAGGDWEENTFSPRPGLMDRGPRRHMTEAGFRREILELNMNHPALLPRQRDRAPSFRKQFQGQGIQGQRVFPFIKKNEEREENGKSICLLKSSCCVLNKSISFSKLNFHLKKRMVEKVLGIPLRVRESREMATRRQIPSFPQLEDSEVAEDSESFPGPSHGRVSKEKTQLAEGQALSLRTLDTQDLSCLIFNPHLTDEEEFNLRVVEHSYSENHTPNSLVPHHGLGFQTTEVPPSYSLGQLHEDMTDIQGPGTLVKLEGKSPSLTEYQKLPSQITGQSQAKQRTQSQRKGSLNKSQIEQGMRDERQEDDPDLLKGHTSNSRGPPQGPRSRILGFSKQKGVVQRKIPLEIKLAEKIKSFLKWLCPKKKIRGTKEPIPRKEAAIDEITEQSTFMVKTPSKGSGIPFGNGIPPIPEDMTVVGLILEKKMGLMDELYDFEGNQQQERELQILETQAEPTGGKSWELRAVSSARAQAGNSKSRGHGKGSEGHWNLSWERQAQDREKSVKKMKKTVRFRDQHLDPETLASIASEVSVSSDQFRYRHRGSRFSRTLEHSQHYPKPPFGGPYSFHRRSPGPSPQYGVFWLPPRESSLPGDDLFS
ncbi:uncharacterized protein [Notamacropus eugenii]|uniref:uncharacterized protein isoform X2 n=1 Tax=Notamacropus eugenii TaxID=9315 RepID=UPI003B671792